MVANTKESVASQKNDFGWAKERKDMDENP